MKYIGYQEDHQLPFHKGQKIIIPAGTEVVSTNPQRKRHTLSRKQTVTIHHLMPGMSVDEYHFRRYHSDITPFGTYERFMETISGNKVSIGTWYAIHNPSVVWVGSGGYWHEVDINSVLEANGIV